MMEWMKKYWWAILIILALPVVINFLLLIPAFSPIVGEETDWLSFWGGYLGSIISAAAAFIILHVQRKDNDEQNKRNRIDNEKQNDLNRQLQIKVIEYQRNRQWLTELKSICSDYYNTFDQNDIIDLCNLVIKKNDESLEGAKKLLTALINRNNRAVFALEFHFTKEKDKTETKLLFELNKYNLVYKALIHDVQFLVKNIKFNNDIDPNNLFTELESYKKLYRIPEVTENRIWDILSKYDNFYVKDYYNFVIKLFDTRKNFHSTLIQNTLTELISYEETKINKILDLE